MSTVVNIRYGSSVNSFTCNCVKPITNIIQSPKTQEKLDWIKKVGIGLMATYSYSHIAMKIALGAEAVVKANAVTPDNIRQNFSKIIDVFSAISEPILWGFAIVGLVLVATGNKQMGWQRVKQVAYSYIGIQCLPAFFAFLRYVAKMLTSAFSGM